MLNDKEKNLVSKVLEETHINQSLFKTYNNEIIPILDAIYFYPSIKTDLA